MLDYLKTHILDEIDGAVEYLMKANEHKGDKYGLKFYHMAEDEVKHATCFTQMFNSMDKPENVTDAEYAKMYRDIMDKYSVAMAKIDTLKKLFWAVT